MTLPTIPRILATTALCLAAVGVSSCVSQNCRSIWRGAYEVDKVWWIEGGRDNTTPIYRYNGDYFVLGKMGPAKGTLKSPGSVFERNYYPILEKAEPAYLRLDEESALLVKAARQRKAQEPLTVTFRRNPAQHLTSLPPGAQLLPVAAYVVPEQRKIYSETEKLEDSAHSTSEKYWRYPLSILTAVVVDVPLTLLGNTALGVGTVVTVPVTLPILILGGDEME